MSKLTILTILRSGTNLRQLFLGVATTTLIASCGGGGGTATSDTPSTGANTLTNATATSLKFSGVVAVGAALSNVVVTASCADQSSGSSAPTDSSGSYSLSMLGTLPCTFSVTEPTTGFVLRSLSATDGNINITPLTEAIYVFSNGDTAKVVAAKSKLSGFMNSLGSPLISDPIAIRFDPNGIGADKNILDFVKVANSASGQNPKLDLVPILQMASDPLCYNAVVGIGTTSNGSNNYLICPKAQPLTRFVDPASEKLYFEFFEEFDPVFVKLAGAVTRGEIEPIVLEAFKRGTYYLVGAAIESIGPKYASRLGLSKGVFKVIANSFYDQVSSGASLSLLKGDVNPAELLITTLANVLVGTIEQKWLEQIVQNQVSANNEQMLRESVAFGALAYGLEIGVAMAIDCGLHTWVCKGPGWQLILLKNEAVTTFGWVWKDLALGADILVVKGNEAFTKSANGVLNRLMGQYDALADLGINGGLNWAVSGLPSTFDVTLMNRFSTEKAQVSTLIDTEFSGLSATRKASMRINHVARLDRLLARQQKQLSVCRTLASEGEVGISKCLNLLGKSPQATLSCVSPQVLQGGACITPQSVSALGLINVIATSEVGTAFTVPAGATSCKFGSDYQSSRTTWMYETGGATLTASGYGGVFDPNTLVPTAERGSLIVRRNSGNFKVGDSAVFTVSQGEILRLAINDIPSQFADNSGALAVNWVCGSTNTLSDRFVKIANSGSALPANASKGEGFSDWACTADTLTGYLYEVKMTSGLRKYGNTYTFYTSTLEPQKFDGTVYSAPSSAEISSAGNAQTYIALVNSLKLCGKNNWSFGVPWYYISGYGLAPMPAEFFGDTAGTYWTGGVGWSCPFGGCNGSPLAFGSYGSVPYSPCYYGCNTTRQSPLNLWLASPPS
jgi:hypothetical protein